MDMLAPAVALLAMPETGDRATPENTIFWSPVRVTCVAGNPESRKSVLLLRRSRSPGQPVNDNGREA